MLQEVRTLDWAKRGKARCESWVFILVFAALLLVPATTQLVGLSAEGSSENRTLATFPKIRSLKDFKTFPKAAEAYVNDRFGLRQQLVRTNSWLRYHLGVSSTKDVVIGRDGWLFYTASRLMEQHTGEDVFTQGELEHWVTSMEATRDWLALRNIPFFIVVAPDKNTIYPEKLPGYPRAVNRPTRLDQVVQRLGGSSLEFVDPREALIKEKLEGGQVYVPGDTHWTERGAFVAYSLLMRRIQDIFPDIEPLSLADFDLSYGAPLASDLAVLLGLERDLQYTVQRLTPKKKQNQLGPSSVSMRSGWGWPIHEIKTSLQNKPRLLVYGDSFTSYVLGPYFLYETFRDPVYTNHSGGTFNLKLVDEFKPDLVIVQIAERYLNIMPQKSLGFDDNVSR